MKAKDFDRAKETLNGAISFLQDAAKVELSPAAVEPFIAAAKAAIAHLPYDQDPGREAFEKADALRETKKFADAAKAYQGVMKDFPRTDYAPRSEMSLGYCLVGLKQADAAVEHWKKFITASPAGNWRGQAYVGIIDVCLEEVLNLTEANKWAELAGASLDAGLADSPGEPRPGGSGPGEPQPAGSGPGGKIYAAASWKKCVLDIYLRRGLVAFLMEKNKTAVDAFERAKLACGTAAPGGGPSSTSGTAAPSGTAPDGQAAPSGTAALSGESTGIVAGLDRLIAAAKAGKAVTPDEVHDAKADKRVALLCAMGTIYNCTEQYKRAESTFSRVVAVDFTPAKTKPKPAAAAAPADHAADPAGAADPSVQPALPSLTAKISKGPLGQSATAAQFSYALFGLGAALQGQAKLPPIRVSQTQQAVESFAADLKTFPDATWHDETLYRLATIIDNQAELQFGEPADSSGYQDSRTTQKSGLNVAGQPPTAQQKEALKKAEKQRCAALLQARGSSHALLERTHPEVSQEPAM